MRFKGRLFESSTLEKISDPVLWLAPGTKKPVLAKSIAIDSSLWILAKNNQIDRYYKGDYKDSLNINLFPKASNFTKILTNEFSPNIYILEPKQNRLIILTKDGKILKQYQSDKFDRLLDFTVSKDERTFYILNDRKVYQINI